MKKFRKLAASIAAITTALSLSVGTLAVTANEVKKAIDAKPSYTLAEKQFVESYKNTEYLDAAELLIDNDISLAESENIMKEYIKYKEKKAERKAADAKIVGTRTLPNFYHSAHLSNNQHYGVVISDTGNVHDNNIGFYVWHTTNKFKLINPVNIRPLHTGVSLSGYYSSVKVFHMTGSLNLSLTNGACTGICDFPFEVCSTYTNEEDLHTISHFDDEYNDTTAEFRYETYVRGDVNHDGIVNEYDIGWLVDYNLGQNPSLNGDYGQGYVDMTSDYAILINALAADADRDGSIGLSDLTWVNAFNADPITTN